MKHTHRFQFDLMANATDSLRQAVELLAWKNIGNDFARLKHAITNVAHAIELLLKERLRRVNPAFVWENVDKYPSLEARTVTVETAISRLNNICNVSLSNKDKDILRSLRRTRNAIEHYEWVTTEKEAKVIVGSALSFAFSFSAEYLDTDLTDVFKQDDTWQVFIDDLPDFVRAHGERLESILRMQGDFPTCCDTCGELTIPRHGGSCSLCGHWQWTEDDLV
jgi:hypothetical protein